LNFSGSSLHTPEIKYVGLSFQKQKDYLSVNAMVHFSICAFFVQTNDVLSNAVWLFVVWEKQKDILLRSASM
jgi:hypothetical protein